MNSPAESEIPGRASLDTVFGDPPNKQGDAMEVVLQGVENKGQDIEAQTPGSRSEDIPSQSVEWEHIRNQLGMVPEERRIEWEQIRDQLGLSEEDEGSVSIFKQIAQACLVLATTPFMLLHGVFKMTGALLRSLGMIFTGLGQLSSKLTYKPGGRKNKRTAIAGPIQI